MQQRLEVMMGILMIVKVKFRSPQLQEAPERRAQVGTEPHKMQVCDVTR